MLVNHYLFTKQFFLKSFLLYCSVYVNKMKKIVSSNTFLFVSIRCSQTCLLPHVLIVMVNRLRNGNVFFQGSLFLVLVSHFTVCSEFCGKHKYSFSVFHC